MWVVKKHGDRYGEEIECSTEREAYEYCKEFGKDYYYEWKSTTAYLKGKTKQWLKLKKLSTH